MAAHTSFSIGTRHTLTIVAIPVTGLDLKPYVEYRLEERKDGEFVGYIAMGSKAFVEDALKTRLKAAYSA